MIAAYKGSLPVLVPTGTASAQFRVRFALSFLGSRSSLRALGRSRHTVRLMSSRPVYVGVIADSYNPLGLGKIMAASIKQTFSLAGRDLREKVKADMNRAHQASLAARAAGSDAPLQPKFSGLKYSNAQTRGLSQAMGLACRNISGFGLCMPHGAIEGSTLYRPSRLEGSFTLAQLFEEVAEFLD